MKRTIPALFILAALFAVNSTVHAQCKSFAKKICKQELIPYIHDGNYHAAILTEGEEAELYKTFYSGQNYRIAVCGAEPLTKIEFQVVDAYKNVLYDNREHDHKLFWDFKLESSQQLKIVIKVPTSDKQAEYPFSSCVAIMFGFKEK
ncbi:MAG: hypothetical protein JXR41_03940 [Bacteroidales bacterium]|nr:hypothetical protein [Bacteroidales bacterium]MBN2762219.1 hypothetical protein [Bacteroidales bacterium]